MFASFKVKQQKQVRQLQSQEQCIDHVPYYLRDCRVHIFFPTTLLEIAVCRSTLVLKAFQCDKKEATKNNYLLLL